MTRALDLSALDGPAQSSFFDASPVPTGEPLTLPIDKLVEDPDNPRTEYPQADIDELGQDIALRGILQPIVVAPPDAAGRHRIRFGAKRWRAAKRVGLAEVPVMIAARDHDGYDQVAENLMRHGLSPLELTRFIRRRVGEGASNAAVARRLGVDLTTMAHHLALLALPPVLDEALKSGRCASPRTLYELGKLHQTRPDRVNELVGDGGPITRDAVAAIRDELAAPAPAATHETRPRPHRAAQVLARVTGLCERLDAALRRLGREGRDTLPAGDLKALRVRIAALVDRLDP